MAGMDADKLEEAAIAWFVRLQDCEDEQSWRDHLTWLEADPAHAAAYARIERLWIAADDLDHAVDATDAATPPVGMDNIVSLADRRERRRRWRAPLIAAAAAAIAGLIAFPQIARLTDPPSHTYRTDGSGIRVVRLADGSRLTLNRNSAVTVRIGDDRRTASLTAGEVLFDVHHEASRPFTVTAAGRDVRVLGTAFDVLDRGGTFSVAVRHGLVSVSPADGHGAATRLPAGSALVRAPGDAADTIERINPDEALAWARRQLVFADTSIDSVARELSRYMDAPIAVDPALRGLRVNGVLTIGDREHLKRQVAAALPLRIDTGKNGMSLVPAR